MRKLFHVEGIVDFSIMHELMTLLDGKSMNVSYRPVKHGGEDEKGELKSKPTGREIILSLAHAHKQFTTKEVQAEVRRLGASAHAGSVALHHLKHDGILKRIGKATYALTPKGAKQNGADKSAGA